MRVIILIIIFVILLLYFIHTRSNNIEQFSKHSKQLNKRFYKPEDINLDLLKIYDYDIDVMKNELDQLSEWLNWPEQHLYDNLSGTWKVMPFYGFGIWVESTCNKCPIITKFLKNIKGLKLATLSRLSPHMKLTPHQGWGSHSNHVIRCHFGIKIPDKNSCYISVRDSIDSKEEIQYHKEKEWLIFDDSKIHYAENKSDFDRTVLIIDVERPQNIKQGSSIYGDVSELNEFVKQFNKYK